MVASSTTTSRTFGTKSIATASGSASRNSNANTFSLPRSPASFLIPKPPIGGSSLTSGLISQLAEVALKSRLKTQSSVSCDVTASSTDLLLRGAVGPVTVRGRGWQSGLGLSCRAIEATVENCEVDTAKIISKKKIVLRNPAKGRAMIALNADDFGNFITHPLMRVPTLNDSESNGNNSIEFVKDEAKIDPQSKAVIFHVVYQNQKFCCTLQRDSSPSDATRATVEVTRQNNNEDDSSTTCTKQLSVSLSDFFNNMVFELDGTFLTFRDLMITEKGSSPSLMLALDIVVQKLPSRSLAF